MFYHLFIVIHILSIMNIRKVAEYLLGKRLKELRGKRIQQEIADSLGISRGRYSHYENEHVQPDNEMLQKMADIHKVTVDYLLGRTNNPHKELSEGASKFMGIIDLSDEQALQQLKSSFTHQGKALSDEAAMEILRYAQYRAAQN